MSDFQSPQLLTVSSEYDGQRLDNFLHRLLGRAPKSLIYRIIRRGEVRINGGRAKPDRRLASGDILRVPPVRMDKPETGAVPSQFLKELGRAVLAESDDFLIINKPAGMAVHAGSGLSWGLIDALKLLRPDQFLELAHRLDRYTSGCLLLAKTGAALRQANEWFANGQVSKSYLCVVNGRMKRNLVRRTDPLLRVDAGAGLREVRVSDQGKPADTEFLTLANGAQASLLRANIGTGRTHQIRVHAQAMRHPILGDDKYGTQASRNLSKALSINQILLHSYRLDLPVEAVMGATAPLPERWLPLLDQFFSDFDWRAELQFQ